MPLNGMILLTKKDAQFESCEFFGFFYLWQNAAQETAPQTALRDFSKEALGEVEYIRFW